MSAATQVYYASFDTAFFKLRTALQARIGAKIDEIGLHLASYPHHRLKGSNRFRARVGDYLELFTPSTWRRTRFISSPSDIGVKFIAFESSSQPTILLK